MAHKKNNKGKNTPLRKSSASDILGSIPKKVNTPIEAEVCFVCNKKIPAERITALKSLGTPVNHWTHAKCSPTQKIKGIYTGEVGTSKLLLVDKLYNDSVRSVFRQTEAQSEGTDGHGDGDFDE